MRTDSKMYKNGINFGDILALFVEKQNVEKNLLTKGY